MRSPLERHVERYHHAYRKVFAVAMTVAAVIFGAFLLLGIVAAFLPVREPRPITKSPSTWIIVLIFAPLTIITIGLAKRLWRKPDAENRPIALPRWTIEGTGLVMLALLVAMQFTDDPPPRFLTYLGACICSAKIFVSFYRR